MNMQLKEAALAVLAAISLTQGVFAKESKEEADKLKTSLTPTGAERGANKDGSIPAWTGGLTKPVGAPGARLPADPFASEKPVVVITDKNVDEYADKLTDGTKFLLKNYPGYKIQVYPTHRTFAAPQWVYDNTYKNALEGSSANGGLSAVNVHAGIPFPMPKTGEEVMHNNNFNWRGTDFIFVGDSWNVAANGTRSLASSTRVSVSLPYYYNDAGRKNPWGSGTYSVSLVDITAPSYSAGERAFTIQPADYVADQPKSWSYLTGQRRLRKTPNVQYDVPFPYTAGMTNFDDANGFLGALDRYDWKLLGKKEIYVPYNTNGFALAEGVDKVMGPKFANPDLLRWELHRVWVVDAKLKSGARHTVPHKRFYVDEDSWWVLMADHWDAKEQFWKTIQLLTFTVPEIPVMPMVTNLIYNVQSKGYAVLNSMNAPSATWTPKVTPPDEFSTQALERGGVR